MLPAPYPVFNVFQGKRIHIGLTGSIAAYKIPDFIRLMQESSFDAGCTLTRAGREFVTPLTLRALGVDPVYDQGCFDPVDTPFAHLAGRTTLDLFLIAPATANILAKAAAGLADDLLSTQILSCPGPVYFAPAMNPAMWNNSITRRNLSILESSGHKVIPPEQGSMACGESGTGRLAHVVRLYFHSLKAVSPQTMDGQKVLVTAGPTHEYFDLVRYWGNPSSGRMGLATALALWIRGARVHLVHGPMPTLVSFPGLELHPVTSAEEMYVRCRELWPDCRYGIFAAAVADFAPEKASQLKFKKTGQDFITLSLHRTRDILAELSRSKSGLQKVIGFAAETDELEENARKKLWDKDLDLIVANLVSLETTPFGSDDNQILLLDRHDRAQMWPRASKAEIAWRLVDWIAAL